MRYSASGSSRLVFAAVLGFAAASAGLPTPPAPASRVAGGPPPGPATPIGPGDAAIDFTLADASGASYMLDDYRGELVLLWFLGYG